MSSPSVEPSGFWIKYVIKYSGYACNIGKVSRTQTNQNSWPVLPCRWHTPGKKGLPRLAYYKFRHKHSPRFEYQQWNTFSSAFHTVWYGRIFVRWKHWRRTTWGWTSKSRLNTFQQRCDVQEVREPSSWQRIVRSFFRAQHGRGEVVWRRSKLQLLFAILIRYSYHNLWQL